MFKRVDIQKIGMFQKGLLTAAVAIDKIFNNNVNTKTIITSSGTEVKIIEQDPGAVIIIVDDIMILA